MIVRALLHSGTRSGTAYLPSDVPKVDARELFRCTFKKENTDQLSTGTIAVQTVANVAGAEAAAIATTHELHDEDLSQTVEVIAHIKAELELEQLSIDTTAAQTIANAAAEEATASATALERATAEQTVAIDADEQAAAISPKRPPPSPPAQKRKSGACNSCS